MTNKKLKRKIAVALSVAIATTMVTTAVPVEFGGMVAEAAKKNQIKEAVDKLTLNLVEEEMEYEGKKIIKVSAILKTKVSALQAYGIHLDYNDKKLKPIEILDEYGLLSEAYYDYDSSNGALKSAVTSNYAEGNINGQYADATNPILKEDVTLFIAFFEVLDNVFGTTEISIIKDDEEKGIKLTGSIPVWKGDGEPDEAGNEWEAGEKTIALAEDSILTTTYDTGIAAAIVKFDANGGKIDEKDSISTEEVVEGSQVDLPLQKPVWGNRVFLGWSKDKTAEKGEETGKITAENVTYYAIWGKSALPENITAKVTGTPVYNGNLKAEVTTENVPEDAGTASYQWYRGDEPITGATKADYTPVKEDIGQELSVAISYEGYTGQVKAKAESKVIKAEQAAPLQNLIECTPTANQITVKKIENTVYSIDGKNFTEDNVFTGLEPKTTYEISVKYKETDTHLESDATTISVTTAKAAPTVKDKVTAKCAYGTTLAAIKPIGEMVYNGKAVEGTFEWNEKNANEIYPKTGEKYKAIFRPNDTETYAESVEVEAEVSCEAKKITVKAISASAIYGEALPSFDFEMDENDLVGSDTKEDLVLILQTNASQRPDAGEYTITKKECGNPNYDITVEPNIFIIEKAKPTIEITNTKETQGSVTGAKAVITPESADAQAVIEYRTTEADAWTEKIPTEVGTYTVRAYLPEEKAGKNLFAITSGNAIMAEYRIEKKASSGNEGGNTKPGENDNTGGNGGNTGGNTGGNSSSGIGGGSSSGGSVVTPPADNKPSKEDQNTDTSNNEDITNPPSDNTDKKDNTGKDNNTSSDNKQDNEKDNNKGNSTSKNKNKKPAKKKKVKLNKKKASVKVGKTIKLKVLNTKKKVAWSSNKPKIAKVNKKGKVTALKPGKAVIKAKIKNGKTLKFKITIKKVSKNKK